MIADGMSERDVRVVLGWIWDRVRDVSRAQNINDLDKKRIERLHEFMMDLRDELEERTKKNDPMAV